MSYPGNTGFNPNQQPQYGQPQPQYGQPMQPQMQQYGQMMPGQHPQQMGQMPMQGQGQFQQMPPGQFQPQQSVANFQQQPMLAQPAYQQQPQMMGYGQPQIAPGQFNIGQTQMTPQQLQQLGQQQRAQAQHQPFFQGQQQAAPYQQQMPNQPLYQQQPVPNQQFYQQQVPNQGPNQQLQQQQQSYQHVFQQQQKRLEEEQAKNRSYELKDATEAARRAGQEEAAAAFQQQTAAASEQRAAQRATVHDAPNFDPEAAAQGLRKAMKGFGCDKKAVADIIGSCSNRQRQEIIHVYPQQEGSKGRDLIKDLKSELRGNLERLVKALMRTPASYDASELRKAMKGVGCDEEILIEILCTRSPEHLEQVKVEYNREYGRDLVEDVKNETKNLVLKSRLKDLLDALLTKPRDPEGPVDVSKAALDATTLFNAGENKFGTDQDKFTEIFSQRSYAHLAVVFKEYQKVSKYDIRKSIKREMGSSNYAEALQAIVGCVRDLSYFFAKKLKQSMKGVGTQERTLIRVCVSRSEIDMADIKDEFSKRDDVGKGQTLAKWIKDDVGGEFERLLLKIIDAE